MSIQVLDDQYLTDDELAATLKQSVRTNKRWRDDRSGPPFIRLRGRILYRVAAVNAWLRAKEGRAA
jgi:hypothetical protein